MSTDQVVSRYPQEWLDAAWAAVRVTRRSFASDTSIANAVLAALEEVGALRPTEIEYGAAKFYDNGNYALMEVYQDRADAEELVAMGLDRYPSSKVLQRHVAGPWVEVPDA